MDKKKFSKGYQQRIEKAEKEHEKEVGAGYFGVQYWPMPRRRTDLRELKRQLKLGGPVEDYVWIDPKIEDIDEALRWKTVKLFVWLGIAALFVAVVGVIGLDRVLRFFSYLRALLLP